MEEKQRFTEFVTRYKNVVCATAYAATGDRALSEEVAQEAFLIAWRRLPELDGPPSMPGWLCGIARNVARNVRRRGWRERPAEAPLARSGDPSPLDALLAKERDQMVGRALARVPAKYREPLVLFYRAGKSVRVVADALGLEAAAVRQRLSRGRRYLKREVDLVERELPRSQPGPAFVAAVVGCLGVASRDAVAVPIAAASSRTAAALLPTAALCGAIATWSVDEPAQAAPPPPVAVAHAPRPEPAAPPVVEPLPIAAPLGDESAAADAPPSRAAVTGALVPELALRAPAMAPAAAAARAAGRSRTLDRALELYQRKQYHSASIELYKVVQEETEDSVADRQLAAFTLGKTLYHLDFHVGALAYFEQIVDAGPSHPYHRATLRWLGALARTLPDPSGIAALVARYPDDAIDGPAVAAVRDELAYLLGRHYMTDADPQRSLDAFARVGAKSDRYADAQFLSGVMQVRASKASQAARAFERAADGGDGELANLAVLNLARLYYSTGDYDRSAALFDSVGRKTELWSTALVEGAWAYFLAGHPERGLGHLFTLESPYFDLGYYPEAPVIEATVYFDRCHFDRAGAITREFEQRYGPLIAKLKKVARKHGDDEAAFYRYARRLRDRNPPPDPARFRPAIRTRARRVDSVWRLAASALRDRDLDRRFAQLDTIAAEIARYEEADAAWKLTAVAIDAMQVTNVQYSLAEAEAGRRARKRLERLVDELVGYRADMRRIRIEILNAKAGAIAGGKRRDEPAPRIYAIDDQATYWPWQGEYWRDELGRYYVQADSLCKQ